MEPLKQMAPHSDHADVLIAGGGIAGSALAILLGRAGFCVELYERAQFPREKPCGEGLMPAGVAVLERLGLAEAAGGTPFRGIRYHLGQRTAEGPFPEVAGLPVTGRAQRRLHLDKVLFQAAASTPGVRARAGIPVEAPLCENSHVAGLVVAGEARRARLVVAADGVHSRLRCALSLDVPARRKRIGMRAHFRLAPGQAQPEWVDVFVARGYELYVAPLPKRELLVAALANTDAFNGPMETALQRWVRAQPVLAARLAGAQQASELLCTSPLAGRARAGTLPGVVLLGDAAGFSDPITGGGMAQALQTAELLAGYVRARLGKDEDWLSEFDRARWALLRDYWRLTRGMLWLADHPRIAKHSVNALRMFPGLLSHLIGVAGGVRPLVGKRKLEIGR